MTAPMNVLLVAVAEMLFVWAIACFLLFILLLNVGVLPRPEERDWIYRFLFIPRGKGARSQVEWSVQRSAGAPLIVWSVKRRSTAPLAATSVAFYLPRSHTWNTALKVGTESWPSYTLYFTPPEWKHPTLETPLRTLTGNAAVTKTIGVAA